MHISPEGEVAVLGKFIGLSQTFNLGANTPIFSL